MIIIAYGISVDVSEIKRWTMSLVDVGYKGMLHICSNCSPDMVTTMLHALERKGGLKKVGVHFFEGVWGWKSKIELINMVLRDVKEEEVVLVQKIDDCVFTDNPEDFVVGSEKVVMGEFRHDLSHYPEMYAEMVDKAGYFAMDVDRNGIYIDTSSIIGVCRPLVEWSKVIGEYAISAHEDTCFNIFAHLKPGIIDVYWSHLPFVANMDGLKLARRMRLAPFVLYPVREFYNARGDKIDKDVFEVTEQQQCSRYIEKHMHVIELGGRYGMSSVAICDVLAREGGSGCESLAVVEPDSHVWEDLYRNIERHGYSPHIFQGAISLRPLKLCGDGYGTHTSGEGEGERTRGREIQVFSLEEVETRVGWKADALVADCEGALGDFFKENPHLYDQLELIIMEKDRADKCNYDEIEGNLLARGWKNIENKDDHVVWKK